MRMFIAAVISVFALSVSTVHADNLSGGPRVWVQPFNEANNLQTPDWITRTLHQSLVDELAATKDVQLMQSDGRPAGAQFIVVAQIQREGSDLRVSGQVIDAATNKSIGGFKATGDQRELFSVEDTLASQINNILPKDGRPLNAAAATTQPVHVETPFAPGRFGPFDGSDLQQSLRSTAPLTAPPAPTPVYDTTPVYTQPNYPVTVGLNGNYPYGYGGYGYGYGYGYGWPSSVIIINHDHDGHHNGGGGNGGGGNWTSGGGGMPPGNGQAIRSVSGYGGTTPPPGVINTMGGPIGGSSHR